MSEWSRSSIDRNLSVAVLAGGKSERVGYQKILIPILGQPMVSYIYSKFLFSDDVFAVGREIINGIRMTRDMFYAGILGGIATALLDARHERVLVVGGDMPFVSAKPVASMMEVADKANADIVVPVWEEGHMEPLFAIYSKRIRSQLIDFLYAGGRAISKFILDMDHEKIQIEEWMRRGIFEGDFFMNINMPEDVELLKEKLKTRSVSPRFFTKL